MNVKIGTAPDSWGVWFAEDPRQIPPLRFLDEVAEVGYKYIELGPYGYLPSGRRELREQLAARGLHVCAGTIIAALENAASWEHFDAEVLTVGRLVSECGGKYVVVLDESYTNLFTGAEIAPPRLDAKSWGQLIEAGNRTAALLRDRFDLSFVFHPHAETHIEYEGQIVRFLADTDPSLVGLCLDVGHHAYRHGDPVEFMRQHHERIPYLHLKSVDSHVVEQVTTNNWPFAKAVANDVFCEPSVGAVDFRAFVDVLREIDYDGWAIVEQDMYPAPFDKPLPIAKRTYSYLCSLGLDGQTQ